MTDYNDGQWHQWSGGECPVHPMSKVEARTGQGPLTCRLAKNIFWHNVGYNSVVRKFRVIEPHVDGK